VLIPFPAARMKKRDRTFGERINRFRLDILMVVTTLTGQRQIGGDRFAAFLNRRDMFDGEGRNGVRDRA
jgi:hypothetical protein